jgi:fatty acid desaturase
VSVSTARVMLWVAVVSAILGYVAAIAIALSGDQGTAVYYLVVALLVTVLAFGFYRQYGRLRDARWQREVDAAGERAERMVTPEIVADEASQGPGGEMTQ